MQQIKIYYSLTKPHVTYGNVLTGISGFLFASAYFHRFSWTLFIATIVGMTLIVASACALNNYYDRDIDAVMDRTQGRAIASGELAGWKAIIFSIVLLIIGFLLLILWSNWLVVTIGLIGFVTYVWLYGNLSKRRSIHGALVGSISGAMPIVAGYSAVSHQLDIAWLLLFLMLFFWQFPEFYSIAIYRLNEYKKAGIPVMPSKVGITNTKFQILIYTCLYVICSLLLTALGYTGWIYAIIMAGAGILWIKLAVAGVMIKSKKDSETWAKKMFHWAMLILVLLSIMLPLGALLP